jgi:flavin-dependent dehydrogenase
MVSVGIVAERDYLFNGSTKDHAEIFQREVQNNEWIKEHLAAGEQTGEYRTTGEYSYRNRYCSTDGLVLAGDALGFLDPVFSSGVFLALKSGVMLADEIDQALKSGQPITSKHFQNYGKRMQSSIETMRKIVYAFYDPEFSFGDLVKRGDHLRSALTDCLIGNVDDQDFQELFDSMSDLAKLPEPVEHGLAQASS